MPRLLLAILLLFCSTAAAQFRGLVINEFSQGDQGSREYIELLVAGRRTCTDSAADIRGWIIDDQNGWYGTANINDGHYRFKDVPQWAAVPFGSIILLYNAASGQKNLSLTLPDDSTDADKDGVYVLPINTKTLIEEHDNEPDNAAPNPAYAYPPATSTAGYAGASNQWVTHIALNNTGGDVLTVAGRNKRDSAFFSIGYGYTVVPGYRPPTVSIADVGAAASAWLSDSAYAVAANWVISPVPLNETPGFPNGGVNTTWIGAMRTTPKAVRTYATACSNGPYSFFGQTLTATGAYTVLSNNVNGCVDTNEVYLVIKRTETKDTTGCDSLAYNGTTYTAAATVVETVSSAVAPCDSVVRTVKIGVKKSSSSLTNACIGAGQNYVFNGQTLTASGQYAATLVNAQGCDSVARLHLLKTVHDSVTVTGCGSVTYNGQTYTSSAVRYDTVKSVGMACDSVIRKIKIVVGANQSTFLAACAVDGTPYLYNGTPVFLPGLYAFTYSTVNGCDSVVKLYLVFRKTIDDTVSGCDSVWFGSRWHYNSVVLRDTVKSLVSHCDSVIRIHQLVVNRSRLTPIAACVPAGGSYLFFGQTLAANGLYSHTLQSAGGCDSTVRLRLTVAQKQSGTHTGCDSVRWNGQTFYASALVTDTLRSQTGCDSLIRVDSLVVYQTLHSYVNACRAPGQTYVFNGQVLTASGTYTATFTGSRCDSVVQLNLLIAQRQTLTYRSCNRYTHNGVTYTSSVTLQDTVRSLLSGCDSVLRTVQILIQPLAPTFATACIPQGGNYVFNGQTLTATGNYSTVYSTATGCDSAVNLYLVASKTQSGTVAGCERVVYNGIAYSASAVLTDTVKSVASGCDSIINRTVILVHPKPLLTASNDTAICLGDTARLTASSPGATVAWTGFGSGNGIAVSPRTATVYSVIAVDANGCRNAKAVRVLVEDLLLHLTASNAAVLSGSAVTVQSGGNLHYSMVEWQPAGLFANQTVKSQRVYLDTSVTVLAVAQTALGCADTASVSIIVIPFDDVYIPSGFTPNGDGLNDEAKVAGTGIKELDFKIFNRWGQLVFSSTDRGRGWDGRFGGALQPAGVYIYTARVKKANGQVMEKKGTVALIR